MTAPSTRVPLHTRIFYGFGSVAFGVKDNGFSYFLLIFYNQVLGLSPSAASLVLMLALLIDAVVDLTIGYWSDGMRSRWGRRHPFMYAAILPVALAYTLVWMPPSGLGPTGLFFFLLVCTVFVRIFISTYEIPSAAQIGEITADYDERTVMLGYRFFFGWCGGLTMSMIALLLIFRPTPDYPIGILNPNGYGAYGLIAVSLMVISMLVSSLGTRRTGAPYQPPKQDFSPRRIFVEMFESFSDRSFMPVFASSLFLFLIVGIASSLFFYVATFFWGLSSAEIAMFPLVNFASAGLALVIAPRIARRWDKRKAVLVIMAIAICWSPLPILLRLAGFFPGNDSAILVPLLIGHAMVDTMLGICVGIIISSMTADLVESSQVRTGRRSEGLFFASRSFAQKAMTGVGVLIAGLLLELIRFPVKSVDGVTPETARALGMLLVPTVLVLYAAAIFFISRYRINRDSHARTVELLGLSAKPGTD